jgi:hypothetical protein
MYYSAMVMGFLFKYGANEQSFYPEVCLFFKKNNSDE